MALEAVLFHRIRTVVVNRHRQEVILNIRPRKRLPAANKPARFKLVAGADAGPAEQPFSANFRLIPPLQRRIERHRLLALVLQIHLQVVLQVFTDAGQGVHQRDIKLA